MGTSINLIIETIAAAKAIGDRPHARIVLIALMDDPDLENQ
jgi:hypothetical protein